jgi:hypothetical protein
MTVLAIQVIDAGDISSRPEDVVTPADTCVREGERRCLDSRSHLDAQVPSG